MLNVSALQLHVECQLTDSKSQILGLTTYMNAFRNEF